MFNPEKKRFLLLECGVLYIMHHFFLEMTTPTQIVSEVLPPLSTSLFTMNLSLM